MDQTALQNKVVWVTGSSRGIGAAIATLFAAHGARVAVHGRDAAALATVRSAIAAAGGHVISVLGDVTKLTDVEQMRDAIEEQLGPIDVVVANAGGSFTPPGPIEQVTEQGWHASIDGNLTERNLERIPEELRVQLAGTHPIPRLGTPDDVARAALFLATDQASWITGIILDVAGGATMVR